MLQVYLDFKLSAYPCKKWNQIHLFQWLFILWDPEKFFVIYQLVPFALWFLFNFVASFLINCIVCLTLISEHPGDWSHKQFVWPGMSLDVGLWAKSCIPCQKSKISTHVHSTVPSIPVPARRFSHVHVDIVGPLPSNQGHSYLLTMRDWTTRWPNFVPVSSISSESCARAFISTWISRFRVPAVLTSDRCSQFTSSIWNGVCSVLRI